MSAPIHRTPHQCRTERPLFRLRRAGLMLIAAGALWTGCDSSTGLDNREQATLRGQVTNDRGFSKTQAAIEGAVVTASSVSANGDVRSLDGQATTNAEGRFTLEVAAPTEVMIVMAEKADFESKAIVVAEGTASGTIAVMPMTVESEAEADVYIEARQESNAVTAADVAAYVDADVAAEIAAGASSAAEVAVALQRAGEAEEEYVEERDDRVPLKERKAKTEEEERQAFVQLQASLAASSSTSAQSAAVLAFESAYARAYAASGLSAQAQAEARQAGRAALVKFAQSAGTSARARLALQKKAEVMAALTTTAAIEAAFQAENASQAQLSALAQARTRLLTHIRAATTTTALAEANAEYRSSVKTVLQAELNVTPLVIAAAEAAVLAAKTSLNVALNLAGSAEAVAKAHATFYSSAETSAASQLSTSAKAGFGAKVLTLVALQ